ERAQSRSTSYTGPWQITDLRATLFFGLALVTRASDGRDRGHDRACAAISSIVSSGCRLENENRWSRWFPPPTGCSKQFRDGSNFASRDSRASRCHPALPETIPSCKSVESDHAQAGYSLFADGNRDDRRAMCIRRTGCVAETCRIRERLCRCAG